MDIRIKRMKARRMNAGLAKLCTGGMVAEGYSLWPKA